MSRGRTGVIISLKGRRLFKVKSNFEKIRFDIFTERPSQDVVGSLFQMSSAATEQSCLPRFSLVVGI